MATHASSHAILADVTVLEVACRHLSAYNLSLSKLQIFGILAWQKGKKILCYSSSTSNTNQHPSCINAMRRRREPDFWNDSGKAENSSVNGALPGWSQTLVGTQVLSSWNCRMAIVRSRLLCFAVSVNTPAGIMLKLCLMLALSPIGKALGGVT